MANFLGPSPYCLNTSVTFSRSFLVRPGFGGLGSRRLRDIMDNFSNYYCGLLSPRCCCCCCVRKEGEKFWPPPPSPPPPPVAVIPRKHTRHGHSQRSVGRTDGQSVWCHPRFKPWLDSRITCLLYRTADGGRRKETKGNERLARTFVLLHLALWVVLAAAAACHT